MLHEYAIEPSLLAKWDHCRLVLESFGFPKGRLISRYPKKWERMVWEALEACGDHEKKRITERLVQIKEMFVGRQHQFDSNTGWLENAEREHLARPFHAVITAANPRNREFVLPWEDAVVGNALWDTPTDFEVPRSAASLAEAIGPLLRTSKKIVFIDPYYGPELARYRDVLRAFLNAAAAHRTQLPETVEDLCAARSIFDFFRSESEERPPGLIPVGISVRFRRLRDKAGSLRLHDRHVLTEFARVDFSVGLDTGDPGSTTHLYLTSEALRRELQEAYCSENIAFDAVDELTVHGTRRLA